MNDTNTLEILKSLEGLYLEGRYSEALELLDKKRDIFSSEIFYFNYGTILGRMGDLGAGRYYLEKARFENLFSTETQNNLNYVVSRLDLEDLTNSSSFFDRSLDLFLSFPPSFYLLLSFLLLLTFLLYRYWKGIRSLWLNIALLVVCFVPYLFSYVLSGHNVGIVVEDFQIRQGPSSIYDDSGLLPAGAKIIVGREYNGWHFVKRPSFYTGWIKEESFMSLREDH